MDISKFVNQRIEKLFPSRSAYAHCDIPCGIYDPITAKIAAQTVLKMTKHIDTHQTI